MPTYDDQVLVRERISVATRHWLESAFSTEQKLLAGLLPNVRSHVLDGIAQQILRYIDGIIPGAVHQTGDCFRSRGGQLFRLTLAPNVRSPEELVITFYPAIEARRKIRDVSHQLNIKYGGYSHLVIASSQDLLPDIKFLQVIVVSVINTIYEWTYSRLFQIRDVIHERVSERLYARLREIHPASDSIENLWIGFVHKNRCHYLIDHNRRNKLIAAMCSAAKRHGIEPLSLACELIGMDLPFNQSATRDAFGEDRAILVNIGALAYSTNDPGLVLAERVIYNTDSILVIPITHFQESGTFLVAFCPASDGQFWSGIIARNRLDLEKILAEELGALAQIARAAKRMISPVDISKLVGDILGHAMATFLDRLKD